MLLLINIYHINFQINTTKFYREVHTELGHNELLVKYRINFQNEKGFLLFYYINSLYKFTKILYYIITMLIQ